MRPQTRELAPGSAELTVARVGSGSAVLDARSRAPLRLLAPRHRHGAAWVYASTLGGGLVAGDAIDLEVDVGEAARLFLTTQSSTKVYRPHEASASARQRLRARVAHAALLVAWPDPVCAFAGSCFEQRQELELAAGGSLVFVDGLSAGRSALGERWAFRSFHSVIEVRVAGRLVLRDAMRLQEPREQLGRFEALATVVLLGPLVGEFARQLCARHAALPARHADLYASVSPLAGGAFLRVAGSRADTVARFLRHELAFVPALIGDDPWARRY